MLIKFLILIVSYVYVCAIVKINSQSTNSLFSRIYVNALNQPMQPRRAFGVVTH